MEDPLHAPVGATGYRRPRDDDELADDEVDHIANDSSPNKRLKKAFKCAPAAQQIAVARQRLAELYVPDPVNNKANTLESLPPLPPHHASTSGATAHNLTTTTPRGVLAAYEMFPTTTSNSFGNGTGQAMKMEEENGKGKEPEGEGGRRHDNADADDGGGGSGGGGGGGYAYAATDGEDEDDVLPPGLPLASLGGGGTS
jgi:hypothetical protein